jgi:hypothetical protein
MNVVCGEFLGVLRGWKNRRRRRKIKLIEL